MSKTDTDGELMGVLRSLLNEVKYQTTCFERIENEIGHLKSILHDVSRCMSPQPGHPTDPRSGADR